MEPPPIAWAIGGAFDKVVKYLARERDAEMLRVVQGGSSRGVLIHGTFVPSLASSLLQQAPTSETRHGSTRVLALKNPKGFGPPAPKSSSPPPSKPSSAEEQVGMKKNIKQQQRFDMDDDDDEIPEIVTDRMLKRIGVSVAIPLLLAVAFFPFFWYLKIVLKVDVPEWLPLLVSGTFFGSSALGITYGIVSTSWDPLRDGSLLGWKEAQANWPIFFQNLQGKQDRRR